MEKYRDNLRNKIHIVCFFIAFFIAIVERNIAWTSKAFGVNSQTKFYLVMSIFIIASIAILANKVDVRDILIVVAAIMSYRYSKSSNIFAILLVIVLAAKSIDKETIIKFWLLVQSVFMIFCVTLYVYYYLQGSEKAVVLVDDRVRYCFMFDHSNGFAMYCVFLVCAVVYLYKNKIPEIYLWILICFISAIIIKLPKSKSAALILFILIAYMVLEKLPVHANKIISLITFLVMFISGICIYGYAIGSIIKVYDMGFITTFAIRLVDAAVAFMYYPITAWGQRITTLGTIVTVEHIRRRTYMDCALAVLPTYFGIVATVIFVYMCIKTWKKNMDKSNGIIIMLSLFLIYSISEWTCLSVATGFPVIFLVDSFDWTPKKRCYKNVFNNS